MTGFRARVFGWIRRIPRGRVATYGQIAALAGAPRRARMVGQALANLVPGSNVPWQRVVNAQGRISPRGGASQRGGGAPPGAAPRGRTKGHGGAETRQQRLLEAEGIVFLKGLIDLKRYRWDAADRSGLGRRSVLSI